MIRKHCHIVLLLVACLFTGCAIEPVPFQEETGIRLTVKCDQAVQTKADETKEGEQAFIPKGRPGNRFAALHTSKSLSEVERLRLMVAKLEIENARLKKGYWVEGAGANKEYVTGNGKTTKLSKNSE